MSAKGKLMTAIQIRIETGATIRQRCVVCQGETDKCAVQAFCYVGGHNVPTGAVCESCLSSGNVATRLPGVLGDVPTYMALMRERAIFDFEEEAYYQTGVWPGLEERRRRQATDEEARIAEWQEWRRREEESDPDA